MKKAEELKLYAPEPKRPELDAALCMSVAEGQGMGRYIEGKVLTVAVWDKKEKPLVVWRFFGDYWTGELRGNENPTKGELSPRQIEVKPCQCLTWRTEVPATKGESELLQNYFDDRRPGYLIGIVEDALSAHARKKLKERNARQAAETQKLFENLPEPPEDFGKQVLKVCSDAGFLWVTNDKQSVIEPGGVEKKISIQRARCDSCGGEYTLSELLKHKSTATCECCGEKMQVRNTRYALREKISDFFSDAKQFGKNALDDLKQFWSEHGDSVLAVLQWLWQGCVDLTADIATLGGHLFDLLGGLITGFQTGDWTQFLQGCKELWQDFLDVLNGTGRAVFGELWDPLVDSMNSAWNLLKGFFSWFGDKIQWARNLWNGVKEFFNGADSDDEVDDNQSEKPKGSGGTTSGGAGRKAADGGVSNNVEKSSMGENSAGKSRATSSSAKSTSTEANRKATNAFISGGRPVSTRTAAQKPISQITNNKSINVKQENKQQYTFQVTERAAADRLNTTVRSQETQSTDELARALNYGR